MTIGLPHTSRRTVWTQAAANVGYAQVIIDVAVINVAVPRLGEDLKAGVAGLEWIVDGYTLVFSALLLLGGFLGDRFGARRIFLGGLAVFAATSVLCGSAPGIVALVSARALQGLGAAMMLPCSLALIHHATEYDAVLRAKAVGWWAASGSIGLIAGPVLGGFLLGFGSWRWIFFVNVPICLIAGLLCMRVLETSPPEAKGFDVPGQFLAILALGAIIGAIIEFHPLGIASPIVLALAALAGITIPTFIWVEARARSPLLPLSLFRSSNFSVALLYGTVANISFYGMIFVLSLYFQRVRGYTAIGTAIVYLPLMAPFIIANLTHHWLIERYGSRACMTGGFLVDALGFSLLLAVTLGAPSWMLLPAFTLITSGMGTGVPAMIGVLLGSVERSQTGVAAAIGNAARQAGGAAGVAIFGTLAEPDILSGLRETAIISIVLLVATAWVSIRCVQQ